MTAHVGNASSPRGSGGDDVDAAAAHRDHAGSAQDCSGWRVGRVRSANSVMRNVRYIGDQAVKSDEMPRITQNLGAAKFRRMTNDALPQSE